MERRFMLPALAVAITVVLSGCGDFYKPTQIRTSNGLVEIIGTNSINNTLTISPGTTVRFEQSKMFGMTGEPGILEVKDGGKLIARGLAGSIIKFEDDQGHGGNIYFRDSASNESIIEYAQINPYISIDIYNSMTIQTCKFSDSWILIAGITGSLIQYNTFVRTTRYGASSIKVGDINTNANSCPIIQYNSIDGGGGNGIGIASGSPDIKNNNIINATSKAILSNPIVTINNNYIANCNGMTGVDTTGIQSYNVTYTNPQASLVVGAGCGW